MIIADEPRNLDDHTPLEGLTDRELINLVESKGDATPLEEKLAQRMKLLYEAYDERDEYVLGRIGKAIAYLRNVENALVNPS